MCPADARPARRSIYRSRWVGRPAADPRCAAGQSPPSELPPPPPRNPGDRRAGRDAAALRQPEGQLRPRLWLSAAQGLRARRRRLPRFLRKYPSDRLAPDAQYWLGESLFQRQRYRDAAESFLNVSTKYESTAKAPDALLRLGQSLAALGEKEAACASLAEVARKYPRAAVGVKQGVEREQKRVRC